MSITFGNFTNFKTARTNYAKVAMSKEATADEKETALSNMMDALSDDAKTEVQNITEQKMAELEAAHSMKMTNEEVKFFNELKTDTDTKTTGGKILPQTTVDEIFEDMVQQHPFLQTIGLKNNGISLKIIKSDTTGVVAWGPIFSEITSQLDASFSEDDATQSKATAFMVIPKDLEDFGPQWIKSFVVTQITEAFAVAAEEAFLIGDGKDKPIGLNRDVSKGVAVSGGVYPEKKSSGKLTFADTKTAAKELAGVIKSLSKKENGHPVVAKGRTILAMSPGDTLDVEAQFMIQNLNGQFVTAMPFGLTTVESEFVPEGKVIAFIPDRYDAFEAGTLQIKQFDQTLALEDLDLYTAKQFLYGKAHDNTAAVVYDLNISGSGTTPTAPTTDDSKK